MKIGVDLGGHTILAASVREAERGRAPTIERSVTMATPKDRSISDVTGAIGRAVADLASIGGVKSVGVAVPGMVDLGRRRARRLPNFPLEWDDVDVSEALSAELRAHGLNLPVSIENDANCAALGEGIAGEAIGMENFVVITMGTGIGCGIIIGGHLVTGAHGMAAEAGHVVTGGENPCGCGGMGHAETIAAADGVTKRALSAGLPGDFKDLWKLRGEASADEVIDAMIDAMARTIATITHMLDPEAIIVGGGMSRAPGLAEAMSERAVRYLSRPFKNILDVRASKLGNDAAIYGAAEI
ncbi:MAG: ROK family protein [Synergistaceae bacterium]|jgi:glucokinase|nr:ROK family protein [Synergistaceae bacterium]